MSKAKSHSDTRWGILNHVGGIWSSENFDTRIEAQRYLDSQREEWKRRGWGDLDRHKIALMRLTLSILPATPEDGEG
jgi:hypothetical protein